MAIVNTNYQLRMAHHCTSSHRCWCTDRRDQSPGRSDSPVCICSSGWTRGGFTLCAC